MMLGTSNEAFKTVFVIGMKKEHTVLSAERDKSVAVKLKDGKRFN